MVKAYDFTIVGGGVIGCAVAHALAQAGAGRIVVLERALAGSEASYAAAGVLAVASTRAPGGALFELRRASAALFPALVQTLRDETGADVEYRETGLLELAFDADEATELRELVEHRRSQGFLAAFHEADAVRQLEPLVDPSVVGGAVFSSDHSINSGRLIEALQAAALGRGVEFRLWSPVTALQTAGDRVVAVTAGREQLVPGCLIVAAGAWSADLGNLLGVKVPVRPDKGEMLALLPGEAPHRTVVWNGGYLVPRSNGEILVGSTSARGESDKAVRPQSVAMLLDRALRTVPSLADAVLARSWAGLRPCPTVRRPIIGPLPRFRNVVLAVGHHRSGILLAPLTALLVCDLVLGRTPRVDLQPFGYRPR